MKTYFISLLKLCFIILSFIICLNTSFHFWVLHGRSYSWELELSSYNYITVCYKPFIKCLYAVYKCQIGGLMRDDKWKQLRKRELTLHLMYEKYLEMSEKALQRSCAVWQVLFLSKRKKLKFEEWQKHIIMRVFTLSCPEDTEKTASALLALIIVHHSTMQFHKPSRTI